MNDAMLLGIVPSAWLVFAGDVLRTPPGKEGGRKWRLLLSGGIALVILLALAIWLNGPVADPARVLFVLGVALCPPMCGVLVMLLLRWFASLRRHSSGTRIMAGVVTGVALVVTGMVAGIVPIPFFILLCALLIAVVWALWDWAGGRYPVLYIVELILLGITVATTDQQSWQHDPDWFAGLVQTTLYLWATAAAVVMAARLFQEIANASPRRDWRRILLMALLCIPLLFLLAYQMLLTSVWDVATDGLGGIFLWLLVGLTAIAAAMVLAWSLTGRRRWIALAFALIVPFVVSQAQAIANYSPSGEWGKMPGLLTERRAETIDRAIHQYYAGNGHYPRALSDLVPGHLVYVPPPLMIPGQTWCYEGGNDHYRLAYKYRAYFSSPISVRVHAAAGEVSQTPACP